MKAKIIAPVLAATLSGAALMGAAVPASAAPAPAAQQAASTPRATAPTTVPITGTGTTLDGALATFTGSFNLTQFANQNGQLVAVGTLTGTLTDAAGNVLGTVTNLPVSLPVGGNATTAGTCDILHLDLGPLDLNLLGLKVHLNEVVLDITAQSGPGNLLGNLLCSVAGLLDKGTGLNGLANLLNHLLGL
ncbi:ABC transporter substrate-binding protein [Sinomonas sp. B1-1]|uniref:ABC transporter substrate-binding protein n=1 Tax=Sinomonas sp. B1-1 TaxID=3141454 RepID=UPI003D29976B